MAETIIVFPVMMLVGLGIVHLGLIYQAKSNLEYAAFMSARQSASTYMGSPSDDADPDGYGGLDELRYTVRCRMSAYDPLPDGVVCNGN
ncbi:MAG: pilus assembly protein, partial [Pseudomonadales bacterium]|nr:pilus assembly protein [Pseudomonadales bacterium]